MLTVYCVLWGGKYSPDYVYTLQRMVARHLSIPHRFVCVTDQTLHDVETKPPENDFPGWWQKVGLFKAGFAPGPAIYLDLDVVVVGSLDYLADYTDGRLCMPRNWAKSGHGGWQSSVMVWGDAPASVYRTFTFASDSVNLWGDQEWITQLHQRGVIRVREIERGIVSYKYHCLQKVPEDAAVVCFHGHPKPHEVQDRWVIAARS